MMSRSQKQLATPNERTAGGAAPSNPRPARSGAREDAPHPYEADTARGADDKGAPAGRDDIGFDDGMTTDIDFGKPAPRDEGDNPVEQKAARQRSARSLPPRARPRERRARHSYAYGTGRAQPRPPPAARASDSAPAGTGR